MNTDSRDRRSSARALYLALGALVGGLILWLARAFYRILIQPRQAERASIPVQGDERTFEAAAVDIAAANLLAGVEPRLLANGQVKLVLNAGLRHFREPWARDFGFASYGLLALDAYRVTRECLEVFLLYQKADGQFPIKVHGTGVIHRYLHSFFRREQPIDAPLRPRYLTGHNTVSLDGNALLVMAFLNYVRASGDSEFLRAHWPAIGMAVRWLDGHAGRDGLLHQTPFSDWADSIARRGRILYTNVLYWQALRMFAEAAPLAGDPESESRYARRTRDLAESLVAHFWRPDLGYFVTSSRFDILSSSGNLLAIAWGLADAHQSRSILDRMASWGMANPVPTRATHRPYPVRFIALENRLGRVGHYHTDAAWLWLGGWHVIALARTGRMREAGRLFSRMAALICREGAVHEVYDPRGRSLTSFWYTSEAPLTWSAAMVVYAAHVLRELTGG